MPDNTIELIVKTTDQASAGIKGVASQVDALGKSASTLGAILGGAVAGFSLDKLVESITEAQNATNDLNRQFAQFGGTVGITEEDMIAFADSTSKSTTLTSESLREAQANLLNYTSVTGQSFQQARDLVVDLAAKMGGDAAEAATLLGRALQNPVSGIRLLAQVGVTLTTQQRATIASLVETGDSAQALNFIMYQLQQRVGGVAAEMANTLGGSLTQLKNSFANGFTGDGADVQGLVDSIHGLNDAVSDPKFQAALQGFVSFVVSLAESATGAVTGIQSIAEALAHMFNGADTPEGQLQDKKEALEQLLAQPDLDPAAAQTYISQLAQIQTQLDKYTQSAADAAKAAAVVNQNIVGSGVSGNSFDDDKKPPPLFDPLQRQISLGPNAAHADADSGPLANPFMPVPVIQQYLADTENAFDKGIADFHTHVQERQELVTSGLLDAQVASLENNTEFQKVLDANFAPIKISATKIGGTLDDIDKEGQQVAQDLSGAFASFLESGSLSIRTFGQDFIKVIDQIFAKAISTDIIGALGLGKLFDQPGTSSQFGGLLGAIGGAVGLGGSTGSGLVLSDGNTIGDGLDSSSIADNLTTLLGFAGGGQVGGGPIVVGEDGPEIFTPGVSGTVTNQRQLAFQGGGGGQGLVYAPIHNINLTTDNSDKNTAALMQFLTTQQQNDMKEFQRKLSRNGYKLR